MTRAWEVGQTVEHDVRHRKVNIGATACTGRLVFAAPQTVADQPAERPFNRPAVRNNVEPFDVVAAVHDFQFPAECLSGRFDQLAGFAAVGPEKFTTQARTLGSTSVPGRGREELPQRRRNPGCFPAETSHGCRDTHALRCRVVADLTNTTSADLSLRNSARLEGLPKPRVQSLTFRNDSQKPLHITARHWRLIPTMLSSTAFWVVYMRARVRWETRFCNIRRPSGWRLNTPTPEIACSMPLNCRNKCLRMLVADRPNDGGHRMSLRCSIRYTLE